MASKTMGNMQWPKVEEVCFFIIIIIYGKKR